MSRPVAGGVGGGHRDVEFGRAEPPPPLRPEGSEGDGVPGAIGRACGLNVSGGSLLARLVEDFGQHRQDRLVAEE